MSDEQDRQRIGAYLDDPHGTMLEAVLRDLRDQNARLTQERDALAVALASTRKALANSTWELAAWHEERPCSAIMKTMCVSCGYIEKGRAILAAADQPAAAGAELLEAADLMLAGLMVDARTLTDGSPCWCADDDDHALRCDHYRQCVPAYRRARAGLRAAEGPGREGQQQRP